MKKALKVIGKVLLGIVAVLAVFLIGTCVYDKICLASEKDLLENQIYGQKVEVYGHDMSIYVSGSGDHTLVFMAGSGDSAPIIGYKSFIDRFDEDYRVVVIEKFGYGFSDAFDGSRDVETRVAQNREALKKAGIEGPYILCPHSYSGLESVYWAQNFPEEVEAIVGLDMAVPAAYDMMDEKHIDSESSVYFWSRVARNAGIVRLIAGATIPEGYSDMEVKSAMALVCSRFSNETFANECKYIIHDRTVIESQAMPDVPTLLIVSDGTIDEGWIGFENDYAAQITDVTTVQLDCGHSVYINEPDKCEDAMRSFLTGLEG
jgi:pimeloyl-ACP methyl ester carboxylesterase